MKQSMRKKIQSSMILVITLTMLIAYGITTLVVYRQTIRIMEGEVRQEADYINVALDTSGESYLKTMDNVHVDTRITLIDPDGNVKYDSKEDDVTLQNHKNRPEVKAALKNGSGQDIRESNTLNKEMFYYAVKLEMENNLASIKDGRYCIPDSNEGIPGDGADRIDHAGICGNPCKMADNETDPPDQQTGS